MTPVKYRFAETAATIYKTFGNQPFKVAELREKVPSTTNGISGILLGMRESKMVRISGHYMRDHVINIWQLTDIGVMHAKKFMEDE